MEELAAKFPGLELLFQAGLRSMISAPLIYRDQVIGALHFQSKKCKAYTDRDLNLAERIAAQIAPAIANAQLFLKQQRAEEALAERTAQLERTNRELVVLNAELDDFTNVASHDLQEPLRTLVAFSDLLPKDLEQSLPERAAQDLGFITDAAMRMQTLIQDLLAFSRAGRVAKKREKVSLSECADRALEALAMRVAETGAEIIRDELPEVWGDSTLLTQLYQNLIGNALKFSGDQPPVIRLTAEEQDGFPVFGIKDNGIGIELKYAQQIFQPFRRLHSRTEYEGSGIGLAICHKIVERHGGKIWVESEPGKGAHFRFTISHRRRE
jgi:light-regulated signal transduction histidine kinase (bacteriophytochrome)